MIPFATFDSETLDELQAVLDRAWLGVPLERQSLQVKERMAQAVMRSASEGEHDPIRLAAIAGAAALAKSASHMAADDSASAWD